MSSAPRFKPGPARIRAMLNEAILAPQVRLIDGDYNEVIKTREALARARAQGMDLVAVAAEANPIVCKILDYHKEVYKQRQALKESKAAKKKKSFSDS